MSFTFYLGTHKPHWVAEAGVPLFVSFATLRDRDQLWQAKAPWAMDSGGFMELRLRGAWTISPMQYVSVVRRCSQEMGKLDWAAIQDWMCEPIIRAKTGLSVVQHQCLSIRSLLDLRSIAPELPWAPVVQGWVWSDYDRHVEMYAKYGIDLTKEPIVGVGSVCRRQNTLQAGAIFATLLRVGIKNLHGFGLKRTGLVDNAPLLRSSDSLAWSLEARITDPSSPANQRWLDYKRKHLPGHSHGVDGKGTCANCLEYALWWRQDVLRQAQAGIERDIWETERVKWTENPVGEVIVASVGNHSFYGSKNGPSWAWLDDAGATVVSDAGPTERQARRALETRIGTMVPAGSVQYVPVAVSKPSM